MRQEGESVAVFVMELRAIAQYCDFGGTLELRHRIVCGINDQQIQKKLLAEKALSFDKAMEIALAVESATKGAKTITSGMQDHTSIYHVSDKPPLVANKCFHCGRSNHKPTECYLKDATCRRCNKQGHIERVCRNRVQIRGSRSQPTIKEPLKANKVSPHFIS